MTNIEIITLLEKHFIESYKSCVYCVEMKNKAQKENNIASYEFYQKAWGDAVHNKRLLVTIFCEMGLQKRLNELIKIALND